MKHIEQWKKHWESIDTENYLHHYSDKFTYEKGLKLADWVQKKRRINANKKWIRVKISDLVIMLYPGNQKIAMVRFRQEYSSDNLQDKMDKLQFWIKEGKIWKIIYEGV